MSAGSPILRLWQSSTGYSSRWPLGATTIRGEGAAGREFRSDAWAYLSRHSVGVDVLRFTAGFTEFVLINRPDLIQRVLVQGSEDFGEGKWTQRGRFVMGDCLITREDAPHRDRKNLLRPGFSRASIVSSAPEMVASTMRRASQWAAGVEIDVSHEMACVAVSAACHAMFEENIEAESDQLVQALGILVQAIPGAPVPRPAVLRAHAHVRALAKRIRRGPVFKQFVEGDLSPSARVDEIVALLIASVDTTPGMLASLWKMIGHHSAVEEKLQNELAQVLGGREPTAADLGELPYLHSVMAEVLRLFPPVRFIDRRTLRDVDLDGHHLAKNSYVLLSPLVTHRDPRFHDDPDAFDPERWQPERRRGLESYSYFPFGGGPHTCIGMGLADQEVALIVATLAQRWRFRPTNAAAMDSNPSSWACTMTAQVRA